MRTNRPDPSKRITARNVEEDVLETAHVFASALYRVGAMDDAGLRTMDRLCRRPKPDDIGTK